MRAGREQLGGERGHAIHDDLAPIQHEQRPPQGGQMLGQHGARFAGPDRGADREGHGGPDQGVLGHGSEGHPEPPAGKIGPPGRGPEDQPGLADASGPGDLDQPRSGEHAAQQGELLLTSDERRGDHRHPGRGTAGPVPQRGEVDLDRIGARGDAQVVGENGTAVLEGLDRAGPIARPVQRGDEGTMGALVQRVGGHGAAGRGDRPVVIAELRAAAEPRVPSRAPRARRWPAGAGSSQAASSSGRSWPPDSRESRFGDLDHRLMPALGEQARPSCAAGWQRRSTSTSTPSASR